MGLDREKCPFVGWIVALADTVWPFVLEVFGFTRLMIVRSYPPSLDSHYYISRPTQSRHKRRCAMQVEVKGKRAEERTHFKVGVDLSSVDLRTAAQSGVTDNVSAHGARVLTSKALRFNQRLNVRSMLGSYRSRARVVYCVPAAGGMYAIGLQLYAIAGDWVSPK